MLNLLCNIEITTFTTRDIVSSMMPRAMPREKLPRFVYCMMAVVMTLVFQAMAPPTMDTAPTSAIALAKARRYEDII